MSTFSLSTSIAVIPVCVLRLKQWSLAEFKARIRATRRLHGFTSAERSGTPLPKSNLRARPFTLRARTTLRVLRSQSKKERLPSGGLKHRFEQSMITFLSRGRSLSLPPNKIKALPEMKPEAGFPPTMGGGARPKVRSWERGARPLFEVKPCSRRAALVRVFDPASPK